MIPYYPQVIGEFDTVRKLLEGYSIARFGDGELKLVYGNEYVREPANAALQRELYDILSNPLKHCVAAIPTMDLSGPKGLNWHRHRTRFMQVLSSRVKYYSAFISRPDSAPWINTVEYAELIQQLWKDKNVAIICESDSSMLDTVSIAAGRMRHIECSHCMAYATIDRLYEKALKAAPDIVVASCGPTATCLAARFSEDGVQCIDLGSAGGFLRKLLRAAK